MDNNYRKQWDKTVVEHEQLQVDSSDGTEFGRTIKKFPLLTPREYILAWRLCFLRASPDSTGEMHQPELLSFFRDIGRGKWRCSRMSIVVCGCELAGKLLQTSTPWLTVPSEFLVRVYSKSCLEIEYPPPASVPDSSSTDLEADSVEDLIIRRRNKLLKKKKKRMRNLKKSQHIPADFSEKHIAESDDRVILKMGNNAWDMKLNRQSGKVVNNKLWGNADANLCTQQEESQLGKIIAPIQSNRPMYSFNQKTKDSRYPGNHHLQLLSYQQQESQLGKIIAKSAISL
ncbi:hypothetical protein LINGRAHAP2_LOCUS2795 [Linum grandiflorum]